MASCFVEIDRYQFNKMVVNYLLVFSPLLSSSHNVKNRVVTLLK